MGRRPLPVRNCVVSIGDVLWLLNKLSKNWRVHIWQNYNEKTSFHVQLLIGLIPSHKESPNIWHVISQLRTTLCWNHIVPDLQGSAAHEIPNHWISPRIAEIFWKNFVFPILPGLWNRLVKNFKKFQFLKNFRKKNFVRSQKKIIRFEKEVVTWYPPDWHIWWWLT